MLFSIKSEKFTFTLRTSVPGSENLSTTEIPFKQKDNLGRVEAEEKAQLLLPDPRAAQGGQQVLQNMQSDLVYFQRNYIRYLEKKNSLSIPVQHLCAFAMCSVKYCFRLFFVPQMLQM